MAALDPLLSWGPTLHRVPSRTVFPSFSPLAFPPPIEAQPIEFQVCTPQTTVVTTLVHGCYEFISSLDEGYAAVYRPSSKSVVWKLAPDDPVRFIGEPSPGSLYRSVRAAVEDSSQPIATEVRITHPDFDSLDGAEPLDDYRWSDCTEWENYNHYDLDALSTSLVVNWDSCEPRYLSPYTIFRFGEQIKSGKAADVRFALYRFFTKLIRNDRHLARTRFRRCGDQEPDNSHACQLAPKTRDREPWHILNTLPRSDLPTRQSLKAA